VKRRRSSATIFVLSAVALFGWSAPVRADATADARAEAGKQLEAGNRLYEAGKYEEALKRYRAAYDAFPSPKILFNFGEAYFAMGDLVTAAEQYEHLLEEAKLEPGATLRQRAEARLAEIDIKLGRLAVDGKPAGARVKIDGEEAGELPLEPVRQTAGAHEVTVEKGGFEPESKTVHVRAGETERVTISLEPLGINPIVKAPVTTKEPETSLTDEWWFWTAIGVGAIAVISGVALAAGSGGNQQPPSGELGISSLDGDPWRPL
jgi:hypothetical protein